MLVIASVFLFAFYSPTCASFLSILSNETFQALRDEIDASTMQDDVMRMVSDVIERTQPASVGFILDAIYERNVRSASLGDKVIFTMSFKDSQSFEDEPSEIIQSMLMTMKEQKCKLYVILITNGIQLSAFLKYSDYHRLINTRASIIMLHDNRLFVADLHYIWKRLVNVMFIRKCDTKHGAWYEMSTVPFPARIDDLFLSRVVNFWSPANGYRWKKRIHFDVKTSRDLNGVKLNVAVLEHTPTVFKQVQNNSGSFEYFGLEIDLINTLSSAMNFSAEFYEPSDAQTEKWGQKNAAGNFSGLLGEMDEARADIALGDLHYTMLHLEVMDLSIPYNTECLTFITPEVLSDNTWKTLLLPFSLGMWIGVLVSLFCIGIVFFTFSNVYMFIKSKEQRKLNVAQPHKYFESDFFDDFSASILYTYSMILVVSLPRLPLRWSVRVLTGWWWIYCVLVVVAYRASLTSILANPQPRVTIDTLDVLSKSWLKCGAWGEQNRDLFATSKDPAAQKIGAKLEHVDNVDDAVCFYISRMTREVYKSLLSDYARGRR